MFIILGAALLLIGLAGSLLGRLPGDFRFTKGNVTVYFPVMTSVIISILCTLIFFIWNKFK
ncbi:DUF2905 domain-containing protein [Virgibacillus halophilus]|uniref:DUF2905 domain-containing protein n=2 Tax=Tigheibacillus halophilus TaxID=361280 RepID=A0ABU5CC09_9BACI|nr:DUF2905 domain-containing protein [Virgibacillus halophilus]